MRPTDHRPLTNSRSIILLAANPHGQRNPLPIGDLSRVMMIMPNIARKRMGSLRALAGFIGILLAASGGCQQSRYQSGQMPAVGDELPILNRIHGVHSLETRAMQIVVRDAATLAQIPLADVPVDFNREMLLIVTLGQVTSDQYAIDITRVWRDRGVLRVETVVTAPPPGVPLAMASPYCIAVVPQCPLNVAEFTTQPPIRDRSWQQGETPKVWK